MMKVKRTTPPTIEPVSLAELKLHLRLDSGSFADNVSTIQSLAPDVYGVVVGFTHVGTGALVSGYSSVVNLNSGTNQATGTVDVKIQESDDNLAYTDWVGGSFTQVTTVNDNAIQEIAYTGTKSYIRTVASVLLASCEFSTTIVRLINVTTEDTLLTSIIEASREHVEDITGRALLTQTWEMYLTEWPTKKSIKLPFGNLQSVTSVSYTDSSDTDYTLTENDDYIVENNGDQCGAIVLPYNETWPSRTLNTSNPITITFACGWETAAAVPSKIVAAIKLICTDLYENRESQVFTNSGQAFSENRTVNALLSSARLFDSF